jgi:alkylation response protein AidB-like acyl-CoA dehydrogenase
LLKDTVARLFRTESDPARIRAAEARGFDPKLWAALVDCGVPTMRVAEPSQSSAPSLLDAVLVAEQAGRYLASVPLAEAIAAGSLLSQLGGVSAAECLARFQGGELIVLVPQAIRADETVTVSGGGSATGMLALEGDQVLLITGCASENPASNLGSGALFRGVLAGASATGHRQVIATGAHARSAFLAAVEEWKLLTASALVGLGRQALEMAAEYASQRQQFGKAIGSYQGIAYPLADALTDIDGAQLLIWRAIWATGQARADASASISMAYWWAARSVALATRHALHTFGGYGVSLEYDIQLYYRRGKAWSLLNGDPETELQRIAARLWNAAGADVPLPAVGEHAIEFGFGETGERFAEQARAFFRENLSAELKAHAHHSVAGFDADFNRVLARSGMLHPHWPEQYGGQNRTPFEMAALAEVYEEFGWERITAPITNQVAQIVMQFGSDELKRETLPRFAAGESLACLGFSEPAAGSDVFGAQTRAVRDGEHWLINGQKIFTTAANLADYCFLLARTDPNVPKHKGLSLFLVPMKTPGVEIQAVHTLQDERTNITYYSDVHIADRYRLGPVNGGLELMAATLELEHGGDQYRISYTQMLRHAVRWAQQTRRDGKPLISDAQARLRLARVAVHATVAESLCHRAIWAMSEKVPGRAAFGPMSKLFSTEFYQRDASDLMDLAAPDSLFAGIGDLAHVELGYRQSIGMTIYGGTSEIHRSRIAEQALGMPRSR